MMFQEVTPTQLEDDYGLSIGFEAPKSIYVAEGLYPYGLDVSRLAAALLASEALHEHLDREHELTLMAMALSDSPLMTLNQRLVDFYKHLIESVTLAVFADEGEDGTVKTEVWFSIWDGRGRVFSIVGYTNGRDTTDEFILAAVKTFILDFSNLVDEWEVVE